jgi:hypothetical protein
MEFIISYLPLLIYSVLLISLIFYLFMRMRRFKEGYYFDPSTDEIKETLDILTNLSKSQKTSKETIGIPFSRTLDDERVFMEDLLIKRFNFLIIIFSGFFALAINVSDDLYKTIVLLLGGGLTYFMSDSVKRAHHKHHWIMKILYGLDDRTYNDPKNSNIVEWKNHPVRMINVAIEKKKLKLGNEDTNKEKKKTGSVSLINGYLLPNLTYSILFSTALYFGGNYFYQKDRIFKAEKAEISYRVKESEVKTSWGEVYFNNSKSSVIVSDSLNIFKITLKDK